MDLNAVILAVLSNTQLTQDQKNFILVSLLASSTAAPVVVPPISLPVQAPVVVPPVQPVPDWSAPAFAPISFVAGPSGQRVDNIAVQGTPGTVTLPVTGHVLSLPTATVGPDGTWDGKSEGLIGYAGRVCVQCGMDMTLGISQTGGLMEESSGLKSFGPTPSSWPAMADEYFNRAAYNPITAQQLAAQNAAWAAQNAALAAQSQPAQAVQVPTVAVAPAGPAVVEAP